MLDTSILDKKTKKQKVKAAKSKKVDGTCTIKERLEGIIKSISDSIILVDDNLNVVCANPVAKKLFGKDLIGKKYQRIYKGITKGSKQFIVKQCFEDGKGHEFEKEIKDQKGKQRTFWGVASVAARYKGGVPKMVVLFLRDITERKIAVDQIRELNQQIEFILGSTKTGLDILDSDFNIMYIDPEWKKLYGEPRGKKCYQYFMGRKSMCPSCGIPAAFKTKKPFVTEQFLAKERRFIQVTTIPFKNSKGEWLFAEVNVDITERKKIEEALKKSRQSFRNIVGMTEEAIIITDIEGIVRFLNPSAEVLFHTKAGQLLGKPFTLPVAEGESAEIDIIRKDGNKGIGDMRVVSTEWEKSKAYLITVRDITERKKAEEEIRERNKELERFHKLTVGREIKMIELKKKIKQLEKNIEQ